MTAVGTRTGDVDLRCFAEVFRPPTWRSLGACVGKPTSWWFSNKEHEQLAAKTICTKVCPVRWRCLADNISVPCGIFGGLDAEERKKVKEHFPVIVSPILFQLLNEGAYD